MSALWRINLLVGLFFALVSLVCMAVLLRQAEADVQRELRAAQTLVDYLRDEARSDPATLQQRLTSSLRHVRVEWLRAGQAAPAPSSGLDGWLQRWLYPQAEPTGHELRLGDGRRLYLAVDPRDEIAEVRESLLQLLVLFALALLISLLAIRWAVRGGLRVVEQMIVAFDQVSHGQLSARLPGHGLPEARLLAGQFNQMASALQRAEVQNAELTQALLDLQERERTILAQTLHDDLGQYLTGIRAQVCLLRVLQDNPQGRQDTLWRLERDCEHLQDGFRRLVRDLYPVMLEHLALPEALQQLGAQWQQSQGIDCQLQIASDLPPLALADKAHLYRLLQEALTNVARHAQASVVRIRLQSRGGRLRLLVRDNGCGQPAQHSGVGLRSMYERARCLGGRLRVLNRRGAGWALYLNIPLREVQP